MELSLYDSITERCQQLSRDLVNEGVAIMKSEVPVRSHKLQGSIHSEEESDHRWFIGTYLFYAEYVENGRGPVYPVRKKALYWPELAHPVKRAGPAPANDFVGRTRAQLDGRDLN